MAAASILRIQHILYIKLIKIKHLSPHYLYGFRATVFLILLALFFVP